MKTCNATGISGVASATGEDRMFHATLTRRVLLVQLIPALKGWAKFTRRYAAATQKGLSAFQCRDFCGKAHEAFDEHLPSRRHHFSACQK